jgi:carboxyl-terminal processing protease
MAARTRTALLLALGVLIGTGVTLTQGVLAKREAPEVAELPLEDMRTFVEILNRVKSDYVEPVKDQDLLESAIRGMLDGLDPHSAYLSADEFREVTISTSGKFGGLGIEVQMQNGFVRVVAPIDDTPAHKAGLQSGDLIVRIDETPVKGLTLIVPSS